MQVNKLLLAGWLSVAVFCLLQIVFGPNGQLAMARLKAYEVKLDQRLGELKEDNNRLMNRFLALRTSAEEIRLEARGLGYFAHGEIPVKVLEGPDFAKSPLTGDLTVVPPLPPREGLDTFFRLIWFVLFGIFYLILHFIDKLKPSGRPSLPVPLVPPAARSPEEGREELFYPVRTEANLAPKLPVIQEFSHYK